MVKKNKETIESVEPKIAQPTLTERIEEKIEATMDLKPVVEQVRQPEPTPQTEPLRQELPKLQTEPVKASPVQPTLNLEIPEENDDDDFFDDFFDN